jgi:ABC-type transport system substrate-binding protein
MAGSSVNRITVFPLGMARTARSAFAALVGLIVLLSGIPVLGSFMGFDGLSASDRVAAGPGERALRIGWVNMTEDIATLNPLMMFNPCEKAVIWPCYSSLLTYDEDAKLVGDLACTWRLSQDGLTLTVCLYESAVWYDKNSPGPYLPVTAHDVKWTYSAIQGNTSISLHHYFRDVKDQPVIKNMTVNPTNDWELTIDLSTRYAPIFSALSSIPILPKYIWENKSLVWDNLDNDPLIAPCIGSGPLYYNQDGLPSTAMVELVRNPTWFATEERGWQLRCNSIVYVSEPSDTDLLADFENGQIDIMEYCTSDQYLNSVPTIQGATGQGVCSGFVYELNANQMTDAMRSALGGSFSHGSNSQLLLDPAVKLALAMSVDKQAFIDQVNGGLGQPADSLVPRSHPYYYDYGGPGAPANETEWGQNIIGARELLYASGWKYRTVKDGAQEIMIGSPDYYTYYPLCKAGGASQLSFRFCTPSDTPEWNLGANLIAGWAEGVGIDLWTDYELKSVDGMNIAWNEADYDLWLWNWDFNPSSEISVDILSVMTTDAIGAWSDVFYSNSTYDNLYDQSLVTVEPVERRVLTDEMQRMIYEDHGCQPIAYKNDLFAMRSSAPDHWSNWGNWSAQWTLEPSKGYPWLFMIIEPADNPAPVIDSVFDYIETDTTIMTEFTACATDGSPVEYRWFFGDGSRSDWSSSGTATHQYARSGYFDAYVAVRENSSLDHFVTWHRIVVRVSDWTNSLPHSLDFTFEPSDPDTGTLVYLNASAVDDEGDPLSYSWLFNDGEEAYGQETTHQFTRSGTNEITLVVDDEALNGPAPFLTRLIDVSSNSPPSVSVPDLIWYIYNDEMTFRVNCSDLDERDQLRLTWLWGDGAVSVTNHQSIGGPFYASALHTYKFRQIYNLTVWIDDLTNLPGHNVSDYGLAKPGGPNHVPVIQWFGVDNPSPRVGDVVTFEGLVTDADSDYCLLNFTFGDGSWAVVPQIQPNTTVSVKHVYSAPGPYLAYLDATDSQAYAYTEGPILMQVSRAEFTINLAAGWNLISVPLVGHGYKASTLGLSVGDIVVSWNTTTQRYDKTYIIGVSLPFKDFAIEGSTGYWIHTQIAKSLVLQGDVPNGLQTRAITVPAGGGWALIGLDSLDSIWNAHDVPGMFSGGNVTSVAVYNATTGAYKMYIPLLPFTDFVISPGQGLWILVTGSGILSYYA